MKTPRTLAQQIRAEIKKRGHTWYYVAQQTGITEAGVGRFMKGHHITTKTADVLAKWLDLELRRKSDGRPAGAPRQKEKAR